MTTLEKGNRNENEAKDILKRVYGAGVEKVNSWGNHDPFGFVDLIAISSEKRVKFVQVKTNKFTKSDKQKYLTKTRNLPMEHAEFEVWVRIDRTGWDIYQLKDDEYIKQYEIHICDTGDAGDKYKELVS